jgi:thioredoxin reductase (NADPH)
VEIRAGDLTLRSTDGATSTIPADHVYLMTGFAPSVGLLRNMGVTIDSVTGIPAHNPETLETNIPGVFIAGVVVAGYDANKVFIENGRFHGDQIVARVLGRPAPPPARISRDLDS